MSRKTRMICIVRRGLPLLAAGLCLLPAARPAIAQASPQPPSGLASEAVINVRFKGGTAVDFVEAVREAAGEANIVLTPLVDLVPLEPVELRRVTLRSALSLLEGSYESPSDGIIEVVLEVHPSRAPGALNVYKIETRRQRGRQNTTVQSGVWSLAEILNADVESGEVLTAIEAALDLFGDGYPPPTLRYHRETGLLLARLHHDQIGTIEDLLEAMLDSPPARIEAERQELARAARELRHHAQELEEELEEARSRMDAMHTDLVEWQTRAELFRHELESARARRDDLAEEFRRATMERDMMIDRLRHEIGALEKAMSDRER